MLYVCVCLCAHMCTGTFPLLGLHSQECSLSMIRFRLTNTTVCLQMYSNCRKPGKPKWTFQVNDERLDCIQ